MIQSLRSRWRSNHEVLSRAAARRLLPHHRAHVWRPFPSWGRSVKPLLRQTGTPLKKPPGGTARPGGGVGRTGAREAHFPGLAARAASSRALLRSS
jgi:hypothetical protein